MDNYLRIKIYLDEIQKGHKRTLYKEIIDKALSFKIRGLTVYKGILGFGKDKHLHSFDILALSENLPIIIEIVDKEISLQDFLSYLNSLQDIFVTVEKIDKVIGY